MSDGQERPTGWSAAATEQGPGQLVAVRDTVTWHSAPASLRLATVGGAAKGNVRLLLPPEVAGAAWVVEAWLRCEGQFGYVALAMVVPGVDPGYQAVAEPRPSPRWQRVRTRLDVPAGGGPPLLLLVLDGDGAVWLDDLVLRPGADFEPEPVVCAFAGEPLYRFGSFEHGVRATADGLLIQTNDSRGGAGFTERRDLGPFAEWTPQLSCVLGPGHRATAIRVGLDDADGTQHEYRFPLSGEPGSSLRVTTVDGSSLALPNAVTQAGEVPGLDATRLRGVRLIGDWSSSPVDLTVVELRLIPPTPAILAEREGLAQRLAEAAAARERAAAEREAARAALLAGAPHPADGPNLLAVMPVAPDLLALLIEEAEHVVHPQEPYLPEPGDTIERSGKPVLVVENGVVQESPKDVAVHRQRGQRRVKYADLAVGANRIRLPDESRGVPLSDLSVDQPAAYRLDSLDDAAWRESTAPLAVWWKRKPHSYRSLSHLVTVYLKLPRPLVEGCRYRISFVGVNLRQVSVEYEHAPLTSRSPAVHVSAIGFRPDDPFKQAWVSQWLGTGGELAFDPTIDFAVVDQDNGETVYRGQGQRVLTAADRESFRDGRNYAKTTVLALDFSPLSRPGNYRVVVAGVGCSYPFVIGEAVWADAYRLSMRGLLHHRSGIGLGPPLTAYERPRPMHPADGFRVFASTGSALSAGGQEGAFAMLARSRTDRLLPEAWGGHMDAGDWDRNGKHPEAMWLLLDLFERYPDRLGAIPLSLPPEESRNQIPDLLDEVIWSLDLYRRLQAPDGGVSAGIEATSHPRPGEASWQETLYTSAYAPDALASLIYAASATKLARLLRPYADAAAEQYAVSARRAWDAAERDAAEQLAALPADQRAKAAEALANARNLAALELWLSTGEPVWHEAFAATTLLANGLDPTRQFKAVARYSRLPDGQGDPALRQAARDHVIQAAETALAFAAGNAFGITTSIPSLPPMGYVGYLSVPEMIAAVLPHAWLLTGDRRYLAGAVRACQFAAGANPDNRALTTGLGPDPVRYPLHLDSQVTGQPAPAGITVYGISDAAEDYAFDRWAYQWYLQRMVPPARTWPTVENYWDIGIVPSSNEYTIHQTIIPTACYWGFLAARE